MTEHSTAEAFAKTINANAYRAIDTDFGDACWIAFKGDASAIVYYEDEPDCQVSTGNHPGRFVRVEHIADGDIGSDCTMAKIASEVSREISEQED